MRKFTLLFLFAVIAGFSNLWAAQSINAEVNAKCATPTFSLTDGATYTEAQSLTISTTTEGAHLVYTFNDERGEVEGTELQKTRIGHGNYTVTAYAKKDGLLDSPTATLNFTVDMPAGKPIFGGATPGEAYVERTAIFLSPGENGSYVMYKINDGDFLPHMDPSDPIGLIEDGVYAITAYTVPNDAVHGPSAEVTNTYIINLPIDEPYVLCTNAASLTDGTKVIIATSTQTGDAYAMSRTQNSDNRGQGAVVIEDKTIVEKDADVAIFTVGKSNGNITFYAGDSAEKGYLCAASSSQNYLRTQQSLDANGEWTVSINSTGAVSTSTKNGNYSNDRMRYNPSGFFACYGYRDYEKYQPVYIYMLGSTSSVSSVDAEAGVKVAAADGGVEVATNVATDVAVYTVSGQLVRAERVAEGNTLINVPAGFYVVRAGDTAAKVIVK